MARKKINKLFFLFIKLQKKWFFYKYNFKAYDRENSLQKVLSIIIERNYLS